MVMSIDSNRIVPVQEDLANESYKLDIIRGLDSMIRKDYKVAAGVTLEEGEYAVLNGSNELVKPTATPVANSYLVFLGTDRYDVAATGKCTVVVNSGIIARTTQFKAGDPYQVGSPLTVKLDGTKGLLCLAGVGEPVLGRVSEVGSGYLVYESVRP